MTSLFDEREQHLLHDRAFRRKHSWWVVGIAVAFFVPLVAPLGFVYPVVKSVRRYWWVVLTVLVAATIGFSLVAAVTGHATMSILIRMTDQHGPWIIGPYVLWLLDLVVAVVMRPVLLRELAGTGARRAGPLTSPAVAQSIDQFPVHDARTWPPDR